MRDVMVMAVYVWFGSTGRGQTALEGDMARSGFVCGWVSSGYSMYAYGSHPQPHFLTGFLELLELRLQDLAVEARAQAM